LGGLPLAVPVGMPAQMMADIFPYSTRLGMFMVAVGLGQTLLELIWVCIQKGRYKWLAPLGFLSLKVLALFAAALLPLTHLTTHHGVGLLYLHVMLLGGLTLGLVACAFYEGFVLKHFWLFCGSVLALVASLIPFTPFWPAVWLGRWVWMAAFWLAMPPILCMAAYLVPVPKPGQEPSALVVLQETGESES